jgi:acyl-CoA thioester hydrolase
VPRSPPERRAAFALGWSTLAGARPAAEGGRPIDTPFRHRLRVRWVDTDGSGIIHFSAVFRFAEAAEIEFFRAVGAPFRHVMEDLGYMIPRVHVEADFRRPLRFDDEVEILVVPGRVGRSSIALEHRLIGPSGNGAEPHVVVRNVAALTDRAIGRAVPWPDDLRAALLAAGAVPA